MTRRILVLGGTGLLGRPVVRSLLDGGHTVRLLTRSGERTRQTFGEAVEIVEGSATSPEDVARALEGMDAAHVNLTPQTEYPAMENVIEQSQG
ncbi:MAG: NAD(P)H-binding protein, partial [Myxococcota bacterium]